MGYMPQQQFLTPSEYGAFRTMPSTNMNSAYLQRPGFFQNWAYSTGGYVGGVPIPTYNPAINMMHRQEFSRRNLQDTVTAAGGGMLDAAKASLMFLNPYLGLASMAMPNFGANMVDLQAQMRGIQNMSIPKITSGRDVSASLGQGFSANKALSIERFLRTSSAGDPFLKLDDYRQIMQRGVEHNLFDFSNDAESYKKVIKRLRNQTDVIIEMIDDKNLDGVMKNLKRLQDMGATGDMATAVARQEGMFSRMTGMRHTDMVNSYGQQGALIYTQHGMTGYQGALSAMGTAAQITMAQRMGLISPDVLSRAGGISGLTQKLTEESAAGVGNAAKFFLPYVAGSDYKSVDAKKLQDLISGKVGLTDMMSLGAQSVAGSPTGYSVFDTNKEKIIKDMLDKLGDVGFKLFQVQMSQMTGQMMGIKGANAQIARGAQQFWGMSGETSQLMADTYTNPEFLEGLAANNDRERNLMYAKGAERAKDARFWRWRTWLTERAQDVGNIYTDYKIRSLEDDERRESFRKGIFTNQSPIGPGGLRPDPKYNTDKYMRPTVTSGELTGLSKDFTTITAQEESNGWGGAIGYDTGGGTSYGKFQFSSTQGTMDKFLSWIKNTKGEAGKKVAAQLLASGPSNTGRAGGAMADMFQKFVATGELPDEWQLEFAMQEYYAPAVKGLRNEKLRGMVENNPALQSMLFSTSINSGVGGAKRIFNGVYREGMSEEELVDAVTQGRINNVRGNQYQDELTARYKREAARYHSLIDLQRSGGEEAGSGEYKLPATLRLAFERLTAPIKQKGALAGNRAETDAMFGLGEYSARESAQIDLVAAMSSNDSKSKLDKVALHEIVRKDFGDVDIEDFGSEEHMLVMEKYLKNKFPNLSKEKIRQYAATLLKIPSTKQLILKMYGKTNSRELALAKETVNQKEKEKLQDFYTSLKSQTDNVRESLQNFTGDVEDTRFLMNQVKKTGNTFHLLDIHSLLSKYKLANRQDKRALAEKIRALGKDAGLSEQAIEEMLNTGDFTSLKVQGYDKADMERLQSLSDKKGSSNWSRMFGGKLEDLAMGERIFAGYQYLIDNNVNIEDLYTREGLESILKGSAPDSIKNLAKRLKGVNKENFGNADLISAEVSRLVPTGSGGRMIENTSAPIDADKKALEINLQFKDALENYSAALEKQIGTWDENTKQLTILNNKLQAGKTLRFGGN